MNARFSPKLGAVALLAMGALYLAITLAVGHSAASEPPPDLQPKGAALDVWQAAALLLEQPRACLVDVRSDEQHHLYRLPHAAHCRASARAVAQLCKGREPVLLVAQDDAAAMKLAGELGSKGAATADVHYLQGGAQAWYLALELPVPLFAAKPPPHGYLEALAQLRGWLAERAHPSERAVAETIGVLVRTDYRPTALGSKTKPARTKKRKAISGGCG